MKVIYIAGPYRAPTEYGVKKNIDMAERRAILVWQKGGVALCPHKNSAFFGGIVPDDSFLIGDLEMLARCDAVYVGGDYNNSKGTLAEIALATELKVPLLWNVDQVEMFINGVVEVEPVISEVAVPVAKIVLAEQPALTSSAGLTGIKEWEFLLDEEPAFQSIS